MVTDTFSDFPFETLVVAAATLGGYRRQGGCIRLLIEGELDARIPLSSDSHGDGVREVPQVNTLKHSLSHPEDYMFVDNKDNTGCIPQIQSEIFLDRLRYILTDKYNRSQHLHRFYDILKNPISQSVDSVHPSVDELSHYYALLPEGDWFRVGPEGEKGMDEYAEIKSFEIKLCNEEHIWKWVSDSLSDYTLQSYLLSVPLMRIVFHNGEKSLSYVDIPTSKLCEIFV